MIRLLLAAALALTCSILGTKLLIGVLTRRRIGQPIHEDLVEAQQTKAGTPTMGGIAIVASAAFAYVVSDLVLKLTDRPGVFTYTGMITMAAIIGAGIVGFLDDWIKVTRERNLGLNKRMKILGLLVVAFGFAISLVVLTAQHTTLSFTRFDLPGWELAKPVWVLFAVVLILASTNAVNLTDGMDGLAGGSAALAFGAFTVIGFWSFRHEAIYQTPHALDLAVISVAMLGGCVGFLWWNAAPAKIFMGDTGSLALGGIIAGLSITSRTEMLAVVLGALFVAEVTSVVVQILAFRTTGRRVFRMAPFHHHFELVGWAETTVIIRFWLLTAIACGLGVSLFYGEWLSAIGD